MVTVRTIRDRSIRVAKIMSLMSNRTVVFLIDADTKTSSITKLKKSLTCLKFIMNK